MRTMKHLLLKTSKRRALIRSIRTNRKPIQGKTNSKTINRPETRVIPISTAQAYMYARPYGTHQGGEEPRADRVVPIIRLLASFPQIA